MKSIIEEASSISKAIEKGWMRAGKPKNFSVKIYEEPEKNFFGLTTRSAKIALIFDEKTVQVPQEKSAPTQQHAKTEAKRSQPHKQPTTAQSAPVQQKVREPRKRPVHQTDSQPSEQPVVSDEIKQALSAWISQALPLMNISDSAFSLETSDTTIRVMFEKPLLEDGMLEKALFRSLSYLALATLRTKFKKGLRGLRLVLVKKGE
jgi:predicted RNA-binding protein Jag